MSDAWHITGWLEHFEVNKDGGAWQPGQRVRTQPLKWVRWPAHGTYQTPAYQDLLAEAGDRLAATALGLYGKLLEVAAAQERADRGWILGRRGQPLLAEDMGKRFGFAEDLVVAALKALKAAGWVECIMYETALGEDVSRARRTFSSRTETEPNLTEQNLTEPAAFGFHPTSRTREGQATPCEPGSASDSGCRTAAAREILLLEAIDRFEDLFPRVRDARTRQARADRTTCRRILLRASQSDDPETLASVIRLGQEKLTAAKFGALDKPLAAWIAAAKPLLESAGGGDG